MAARGERRIEVVQRGATYAARLIAKSPDWPTKFQKGWFVADTPVAAVDRALGHIKHIGDRGRNASGYRVVRHFVRGTSRI